MLTSGLAGLWLITWHFEKSLGVNAVKVVSIKDFHSLLTKRRVFTSRAGKCCSIKSLRISAGRSCSISGPDGRWIYTCFRLMLPPLITMQSMT